MQVDQTVRDPEEVADPGSDCASQDHINQAALILRGFVDQAAAAHPEWSAAIQLQAGTASYNAGPDQIAVPSFDAGTTGGDYSNDVSDLSPRIWKLNSQLQSLLTPRLQLFEKGIDNDVWDQKADNTLRCDSPIYLLSSLL